MNWAYGVTTVPQRMGGLLPRTLGSLARGGFDRPRLFVDGADGALAREYEARFKLEVSARFPRLRAAGNWMLSLGELYLRDPDAERFALFQDDLVCVANLRSYLEGCSLPHDGYWNLYSFPNNENLVPRDLTVRREPRVGWYHSNQRGLGALGLVFSREGLVAMMTHPHMVTRPQDARMGWRKIDGGILESYRKMGGKEYVHHPCLLQHLGMESTIDKRRDSLGRDDPARPHLWPRSHLSRTFPGEGFDALTLVGK